MSLFGLIAFASVNAQQNISSTLSHQGYQREYLVHLPTGYTASKIYPVVFVLHGGGIGTGPQNQNYTKFDAVADTAGIITVYPTALNANWADGRGNQSDADGVDDVGFFEQMISALETNYSVDANRVFTCGISNGGFMSYRLALELSHKFTAAGIVAGSMGPNLVAEFPPARRIPLVVFHGTKDRWVPYEGGQVILNRGACIGVDTLLKMWSGHNNCAATPTITNVTNSNLLDLSKVELHTYSNCSADVLFYKIIDGGHTWPGANPFPALGNTNKDINASVEIWKFFRDKSLSTASPISSSNSAAIQIFPNPVYEMAQIANLDNASQFLFVSKFGKVYQPIITRVNNAYTEVNTSNLPKGYYTIINGTKTGVFLKN